MTREEIEQLCRDAGHAIDANNGRCALIENVLCRVTTLCCHLLRSENDEQAYSEEMHRQNSPHQDDDDQWCPYCQEPASSCFCNDLGEDDCDEANDCPHCDGRGCIECDMTGEYER